MNNLPWEDSLLERKVESDLRDLLKTLVAFSNSVKPNHKATILIGEKDSGEIKGVTDPDKIQKKVRHECDKIYPPIIWSSKVYEKENKMCIRVEIEYSGDTPHFGGPAWIRRGSETIKASGEVFQKLIDLRSDFIREISKWLGKVVTVSGDLATVPDAKRIGLLGVNQHFTHRWDWEEEATIEFFNKYWVTFKNKKTGRKQSESLNKLTLPYDDKNERLKIIVDY